MHMTENSNMPQSARMRAQIQANTGNFARQRFSLHGVDLTKFDGGGARDVEDHPSAPQLVGDSIEQDQIRKSASTEKCMRMYAHKTIA